MSGHTRIMGVLLDPRFRVMGVDWYGTGPAGPRVAIVLDDVHGDILVTPEKARRLVQGLQRELDALSPLPPQ